MFFVGQTKGWSRPTADEKDHDDNNTIALLDLNQIRNPFFVCGKENLCPTELV